MSREDDVFLASILKERFYPNQLVRARDAMRKSDVWRGLGAGAMLAAIGWFGAYAIDDIDITQEDAINYMVKIDWAEEQGINVGFFGAVVLGFAGKIARSVGSEVIARSAEAADIRARALAYDGDPYRAIDIAIGEMTQNTLDS